MANHVFVYGSLLADEVVQTLLHRLPKIAPAAVKGYQRHSIKQRKYPATIKTGDSREVFGRVLLDLSAHEMNTLDVFEDEDYYRAIVTAQLEDGSNVQAAMYVWQDSLRHLLYGEWDYQEFRDKHLQEFLQMMEEWEHSGAFPEDVPEEVS